MVQEETIAHIRQYLNGDMSLSQLTEWVDDYQWSAQGDLPEQHLMGILELYTTEISEGLRSEEYLKNALRAALASMNLYTSEPTFSYESTSSSNR